MPSELYVFDFPGMILFCVYTIIIKEHANFG